MWQVTVSAARSGAAVPTALYTAKADLFRTLGHPARIRILELLAERDHAVHELLAELELEPSNLSQQLGVLRRAGLVSQRREAGEVRYGLSVPGIEQLLSSCRSILSQILAEQDALKAELGSGAGAAS
jgi:ArsR family transcriptional regulator